MPAKTRVSPSRKRIRKLPRARAETNKESCAALCLLRLIPLVLGKEDDSGKRVKRAQRCGGKSVKSSQRRFGGTPAADGEGDGETDEEHMSQDADDERPGRIGDLAREGREGQDDEVHEQVDRDAVEQAAEDGPPHQEPEPATHQVVDRRRPKGDDEVQEEAERGGPGASLVGVSAQQTAGNRLQDRHRTGPPAIEEERPEQVEDPGEPAAPEEGRERPGPRPLVVHSGSISWIE